jgi:TonB-dependent starch-binding outer membrane protein SusC
MKRLIVRSVGWLIVLGTAYHSASAQDNSRLTGHITDASDKIPVPAAQVTVTGTTIGTLSNDSGVFALKLPSDAKTLTVRRIGYLQKVVPITPGQTDVSITLDKDVLKLEQQVITGVATTVSSRNAANDVAVVTSAQVNEVPAPTVENALQGKVAGAVIQSNNGGAPGGGLQVQIRGITSINANAEPLYVIDGVIVNNETINTDINAINNSGGGQTSTGQAAANAPSYEDSGVNRIADINPNDIETIEVLKGASASAIYGSKASAGVVVITTKHGKAGKPEWNLATKVGHYEDANTLPIRTFPTLASALAWGKEYGHPADTIEKYYAGPQNYQNQLFGNSAASYEADLSVAGTMGGTQYYLSGTTKYDNGIETNTGYNKQSIRSNISQDFTSNFKVSANLSYVHDLTQRGITGNDNIGVSPYNVFSYTPQFVKMNVQSANGAWPYNPFGPANPFADAAEIQTPEQVSRFIGGGTVNWQVFQQEHQNLTFTALGGADLTSVSDLLYAPPTLQVEQEEPSGLPGTSVSNSATTNYFNYAFNLAHHWTGLPWLDLTTSVGYTRDRRSTLNPITVGQNLLAGVSSPTVGTYQVNFLYHTEQYDQSFYGQEQVQLWNRLTLTGGMTAERSTSDGFIDSWYYYPRASGSFQVPQFTKAIDQLKLRAAFGESGNLPNYGVKYTPYLPTQDGGLNGLGANSLHGDGNIRPESEQEIETGFDLTMFNSRAQFSATVYQKRLTQLLLQAAVAPSLGYAQQWFNGGQFTNRGIELSLTMTPIQLRKGFSWVSTTTFYRNYSVVDALPTTPGLIGNTYGFGEGYVAVGRSVSEIVNTSATTANGLPVQVGDFQPDYRMSFGNEFNAGPFRLYALLDWSRGGNTINLTDLYFDTGPGLWADSAQSVKRFASFSNGATAYVEDASFLKLRQVSFSYTLPSQIFAFAHGRISNAKLSLTGYNLLASFKYDGLDPELSTNGNQQVTRGQEITNYPPARSYFLGLELGF